VFNFGLPVSGTFGLSAGTISGSAEVLLLETLRDGTPTTSFQVVNGMFSFSTGSFTGTEGPGFEFGTGGTFRITGAIPDLGIETATTLAQGAINGATFYPVAPSPSFLNLASLGGAVSPHQLLAPLVGVAPGNPFYFSATLRGDPIGSDFGDAFTIGVNGAHLFLQPTAATPEPLTLLLLGTGVLGVYTYSKGRS
jgi:hypothetical protein